jgi:hypothetical protein
MYLSFFFSLSLSCLCLCVTLSKNLIIPHLVFSRLALLRTNNDRSAPTRTHACTHVNTHTHIHTPKSSAHRRYMSEESNIPASPQQSGSSVDPVPLIDVSVPSDDVHVSDASSKGGSQLTLSSQISSGKRNERHTQAQAHTQEAIGQGHGSSHIQPQSQSESESQSQLKLPGSPPPFPSSASLSACSSASASSSAWAEVDQEFQLHAGGGRSAATSLFSDSDLDTDVDSLLSGVAVFSETGVRLHPYRFAGVDLDDVDSLGTHFLNVTAGDLRVGDGR